MRIVVLGGTGAMGSEVASGLEDAGHDVVRASRASGVDVESGMGLAEVLTGADTVLDCLNHMTISRRRAVEFFGGAAVRVRDAAARAGVGHLVVLSIVNVADDDVRGATGYYAGKAAQEEAYSMSAVPVTLVRTTAWFTLAETFLSQIRLGPVAVVPRSRLRPVHPAAVAALLTEVAAAGPPAEGGGSVRELAGPDEVDAVTMARAVASRWHPGVRVLAVPAPRGMRSGLLPGPDVPVDERRFEDWLRSSGR